MKKQKTFNQISPSWAFKQTEKVFRREMKRRIKRFDATTLLDKYQKQNEKKYKAPAFVGKKSTIQVVEGVDCYLLGNGDTLVFYLHGGCYAKPPNYFHWRFLLRLAKQGVQVVVPLYPRVPQHNAEQTVPLTVKVYQYFVQKFCWQKVVVMGDSSGGGLALALCEYLAKNHLSQPQKCVLFSPWLDVDFEGDYQDYVESDLMLLQKELEVFGSCYRGNLPQRHYFCSPLYGLTDNLVQTYVFVGQAEMFFEDCKRLEQSAKECGAKVTLFSYPNMQHVFVVHPIDEAKWVQKKIFALLKNE